METNGVFNIPLSAELCGTFRSIASRKDNFSSAENKQTIW